MESKTSTKNAWKNIYPRYDDFVNWGILSNFSLSFSKISLQIFLKHLSLSRSSHEDFLRQCLLSCWKTFSPFRIILKNKIQRKHFRLCKKLQNRIYISNEIPAQENVHHFQKYSNFHPLSTHQLHPNYFYVSQFHLPPQGAKWSSWSKSRSDPGLLRVSMPWWPLTGSRTDAWLLCVLRKIVLGFLLVTYKGIK